MEEKKMCKDCHFRDEWDGKCHRFPPALVGHSYNYAAALFPEVKEGEWCGEWKPKNDKEYL